MTDLLTVLSEQRVIAIVREADEDTAVATVRRLASAGLRVIEVSLVTPGALGAIERLRQEQPPDGVFIGAGTVLSPRDVQAVASAGAQYVVSPILSRSVLKACSSLGLPAFPGVATPTEAFKAMKWGATAAKVFPATLWTPGVLRDLRAALPSLPTVPTGGVALDNAAEWIAAGALAVGVGGTLTRSATPDETVRALLASVAEAGRA
jgi:2-dehydro-3-deoxyphosphogluconate aldolase/(4S)-4-hydroxy-2-oxoglutarate aldolase